MKDKTVEFFPGDDRNEDVEGHVVNRLSPEGEDDVEGHRRITLAPEDDDDVEAHVQPPRDLDVERF